MSDFRQVHIPPDGNEFLSPRRVTQAFMSLSIGLWGTIKVNQVDHWTKRNVYKRLRNSALYNRFSLMFYSQRASSVAERKVWIKCYATTLSWRLLCSGNMGKVHIQKMSGMWSILQWLFQSYLLATVSHWCYIKTKKPERNKIPCCKGFYNKYTVCGDEAMMVHIVRERWATVLFFSPLHVIMSFWLFVFLIFLKELQNCAVVSTWPKWYYAAGK